MTTTANATTHIRRLLNRAALFIALIGAGLAAGATPALASPTLTLSSTNTGNWAVSGTGFTPGATVPINLESPEWSSQTGHATLSTFLYFGGRLQFIPGGSLYAVGPVIVGGFLNGYPEAPIGCGQTAFAQALNNGSWVNSNILTEPACPAIG